MADDSSAQPGATHLVILLNSLSLEAPHLLAIPLRYAATAAAMDAAVEVHAVSQSVALLRRDALAPTLLSQIRQAAELGVEFYACPVALAEQGMTEQDLIDEVAGVRGAASLLVAGMGPEGRFLVF